MQHVDLILRTDTPIIHRSLLPSPTDMESRLDHRIHHAHKRRELFTENREVKSYPGYVKDSIHPYNHTVFKVRLPMLEYTVLENCKIGGKMYLGF